MAGEKKRTRRLINAETRTMQDEEGVGQAVDGGPMMSRLATQLVRRMVRCNAEARRFDAEVLQGELWRKKHPTSITLKSDSLATGLVLRGATVGRL
jgi:hypothetical protein